MDGKHYGAGYLTDTGNFLKQLKINSYAPFSHVKDGIVVDLGCGTGMDAMNLADMLGGEVSVVGIDHDPMMIKEAEATVGERTNVSFGVGEVYRLDFEDNKVSGVRMERVVQHLSEPEVMFREVYRVLRPGHPLAILESIWNSLNLYTEHTDIEQKVRDYLTGQKVKNGWAGNRLASDLVTNSFREVSLETYCMVVRSKQETNRYVFLDRILIEMLDKGALREDEYAAFSRSLDLADEGGYFVCSMNLVLARAVK